MLRNLSKKLKEPNFHRQFFTHKLRPLMSVATPQAVGLQGPLRRVVFVGLYEFIAIVVSSLIFMAVGQEAGSSGVMAVAASTIAICWNITFNWLFEKWELRQTRKGRSLLRRIAHAIGFEGGIAAMLIPLMAWWFGISLWEATVMEAGLLVFFFLYTFVFNWCFDRFFGLPASAQALPATAAA
jgi:uncharacterized membrane protein